VIVLGIDAALCNFGIAAMKLLAEGERVVQLQVLRTEPSPKKRRVGAIEDDARRVSELAAGLDAAIEMHHPLALVVEATGAGKGSKAVRAMALSFSLVITIARLRGLPLLQVSPLDVKRAMTGRKKAEKDEIVLAAERRYADLEWPADVPRGCWEHAADAIGAVVAALDTEVLRMARRMAA
jgi:Holliday junction resolvasome RuvABC endonuclease subunit